MKVEKEFKELNRKAETTFFSISPFLNFNNNNNNVPLL